MKRLLAIVLTLALLVSLTGCKNKEEDEPEEKEPLRILVDVVYLMVESAEEDEIYFFDYEEYIEQKMGNLLFDAKDKAGIDFTNIDVEVLPAYDTQERQNRIDELKEEIENGGGPDVFIMRSLGTMWDSGASGKELFPEPEKTMNSGLLLPLDDYIQSARFMDWDKLTPAVMAAGYNEEFGQLILPISYQIPVTYYRKSAAIHTPSSGWTFDDLQNGDNILRNAAVYSNTGGITGEILFGRLADFNERTLTFTEDEFIRAVKELDEFESEAAYLAEPGWLPDRMQSGAQLSYAFDQRSWNLEALWTQAGREDEVVAQYLPGLSRALISKNDSENYTDEEITMIPAYSRAGGVAARVDGYTCINANTRRPDDAFAIVDLLLSGYGQAYYGINEHLIQDGMPTYEYVDGEPGILKPAWKMAPENLAMLDSVRDAITQVSFRGELSCTFSRCYQEYGSIVHGWEYPVVDETDPEAYLHKAYSKLQEVLLK